MRIIKFRHKGLKALYEEDNAKGLPATSAAKIKRMLAALECADNLDQLTTLPGWKLHPLKGERRGEYSLSVTANWRITFRLEGMSITNIDFEDYH